VDFSGTGQFQPGPLLGPAEAVRYTGARSREPVREYVEQKNGGYYVADTRVSLDSVVYEFRRGAAPETILRSFPLIGSLERVYGAITFYLAKQQEVDQYLQQQEGLRETMRAANPLPSGLKERLERTRQAPTHPRP
jgi:uncharacterized protein (DUF433 family)